MSLTKAGPGLLGTYLTWEDLQEDFFELFGPDAILSEEKEAKDIADGRGFVSRIALIQNLWKDKKRADWPEKLAVKMVTLLQQQKYSQGKTDIDSKELLWKKVHNVEASIYEKLGKESDLAMLKSYKIKPFTEENKTKGYLILEFVENVVSIGTDETLDDDLVLQILEALARFHSTSHLFTEEEKSSKKMGIVSDMFAKMTAEAFAEPTIKKIGEKISEESAKYMRKGVEHFRKPEVIEKLDNMAEDLGMERLLCHGDLWTVNMLFTQTKDQQIRLKALIDYQICHFGCIGHDLARLFASVLSREGRKEKADYFIEKYFSFLTNFWPKGEQIPFSLDQAKEAYKGYLPFASFIVAVTIAALVEMTASKSADPAGYIQRSHVKITELALEIAENV